MAGLMGGGRIMHDLRDCVNASVCLGGEGLYNMCMLTWFYCSPLIFQIRKPQPNYPFCLLFLFSPASLSTSLSVSREITVLRQFLGVPPDAHFVGQRFHCHQVLYFISMHAFVLCICSLAHILPFHTRLSRSVGVLVSHDVTIPRVNQNIRAEPIVWSKIRMQHINVAVLCTLLVLRGFESGIIWVCYFSGKAYWSFVWDWQLDWTMDYLWEPVFLFHWNISSYQSYTWLEKK